MKKILIFYILIIISIFSDVVLQQEEIEKSFNKTSFNTSEIIPKEKYPIMIKSII